MRQPMDVMEAIFSTRSMRYLKPDDIPDEVIWEILDAAVHGPSAGNAQNWGRIVIRDAETKAQIASWYLEGFEQNYGHRREELERSRARSGLTGASFRGSEHLAHHIADAPVWIVAVLRNAADSGSPLTGSSIYGAVQNLMLAARSFGVGATLTLNYARHEEDVRRLLELPDDARTLGLIPLGYPSRGTFSRPRRVPVAQVTHWGTWGKHRTRTPGTMNGPPRPL